MTTYKNCITDVPGIRVGHANDEQALTGCTVILCEAGAVGGVDQRGGAPGTREVDGMRPMHLVQKAHAVMLAGGSAFGLDAATGAVRYLEERGVGFDVGVAKVPIVPSAILFDLAIGRADVRPDAQMGYQACLNASTEKMAEGNFGAGAGASVGKILGPTQAMKSGIGGASIAAGSLIVGAAVAVNALGDVIDPTSGRILAGARAFSPAAGAALFADTLEVMKAFAAGAPAGSSQPANTVIGVVATNADLTKEEINKVAQMAHDGLARAIRPAHTMLDGDTLFSLATGQVKSDVNLVGALAAEVVSQAILNGVRSARPAGGLPSLSSL